MSRCLVSRCHGFTVNAATRRVLLRWRPFLPVFYRVTSHELMTLYYFDLNVSRLLPATCDLTTLDLGVFDLTCFAGNLTVTLQ